MDWKPPVPDTGDPGQRTTCHEIAVAGIETFRRIYRDSIADRETFWRGLAETVRWDTKFTRVVDEDFAAGKVAWFPGGRLNACVNALDVNRDAAKDRTALIAVGRELGITSYTYGDLTLRAERLASALDARGIVAGDRIALYLPDRLDSVLLMLACARLGTIYVPIPSRFTAEIAAEIIADCGARMVLLATDAGGSYGDRVRAVMEKLQGVDVLAAGDSAPEGWATLASLIEAGTAGEPVTPMAVDAEHPIFLIYANSAAGIPRGSVFATGGYLVQARASFDCIFQPVHEDHGFDALLCTLDLASAAGQSYGLWGPLLSGKTAVICELCDDFTLDSFRRILDYGPRMALLTSPRVLETLRKQDDGALSDRRFALVAACGDVLSPRVITSAGQSLTDGPHRVINLWVQSESGTALISTYPNEEMNRPGALGLPFPGVEPDARNTMGESCRTNESGQLVFPRSWPSMIREIWGQDERFRELYFLREPGNYSTNDGVRRDAEGFFWFMGRLDDVIKVRGQSLATSEIEAVLVSHERIAEAAVVSSADGEELHAFLVLAGEVVNDLDDAEVDSLKGDLAAWITQRIGEFALPTDYRFTDEFPRTRTGKVVRRVLKRVVSGDISPEEDMSHVANPDSITNLIRKKGK